MGSGWLEDLVLEEEPNSGKPSTKQGVYLLLRSLPLGPNMREHWRQARFKSTNGPTVNANDVLTPDTKVSRFQQLGWRMVPPTPTNPSHLCHNFTPIPGEAWFQEAILKLQHKKDARERGNCGDRGDRGGDRGDRDRHRPDPVGS